MPLLPVTFIVGAGASRPYGLPVGDELWRRAVSSDAHSPIYKILLAAGFSSEALQYWFAHARQHPAESIDAYLATRQHKSETVEIGRAVIALLMGAAIQLAASEQHKASRPGVLEKGDWLEYVIARMIEGANTSLQFRSRNVQVRFVTFNFDRNIEHRLLGAHWRTYAPLPLDGEQWRAQVATMVTHIHGSLPDLSHSLPPIDDPFSAIEPWVDWARKGAECVRVVFDAKVDAAALAAAHDAIRSAQVICFLGFSFHQDNLKRLGLDEAQVGRSCYGSAFGLSEGERARVKAHLRPLDVTLADIDQDCLQTVRRFDLFRE